MTGGTEEFFPFIRECVDSLVDNGLLQRADLGIIDHGMTEAQLRTFASQATTIVRPTYAELGMDVPQKLQRAPSINLVARSNLPALFPGYEIYLWFDADAWAQTAEFFDVYVDAAVRTGFAVAKDDGCGYRMSSVERRWWIGNYIHGFGLIDGVRGGILNTAINIGVVAIHRDAPHWARYRQRHQATIDRTGKINLDQHACHATLVLDHYPVEYVSAIHNWQPILSMPHWDKNRGVFREPCASSRVLSIVHLAGRNKREVQRVPTTDGQFIETAITYPAIKQLRSSAPAYDAALPPRSGDRG